MKLFPLPFMVCGVMALFVTTAQGQTFPYNAKPAWKSYMTTGNPSDIVSSPTVAAAIGAKVDATNGQSLGQTIRSSTIQAGSLDGLQTVGNVGTASRTLSAYLSDAVNVLNYGGKAGSTDSSAALSGAMSAMAANGSTLVFPYASSGYTLSSAGSYTVTTPGSWDFRGSHITGAGVGDPGTGTGTLLSPYTNPYLITSNRKWIYDPAAIPQPANGTLVAESLECLPNRVNSANANANRNWIACRYVGADTGTGGTSSIDLSTEVENWVLNVSGNHGLAFEIDTNFNAAVTDKQWTTGLFLTGGGAAGTNVNSVALSIMHSDYKGGWLPWTTGISIRETTDQIQQYKSSASEAGYFQQAFDETNTLISWLDKMGNRTDQIVTAKKGFVATAPSGFDDFQATRQTSADTGFFIRYFDENANMLASVDKSGGATFAALAVTNHSTPTASTTCARGEMHADDSHLYVCTSTGTYKSVALTAIQ
ncbi:hypothetical protein [Gluconobacter oxydans]|uniref:Uncharacterized protein n=1 Tax=Gluconobacter oxydans (strain 621H) TaxID=290633 RepID=Q5FNF2_GLUOX|nr:hypothetical protein [Gluconobacter oxydans]AAW62095.1 Hypothetical protein GOX2363 [Gluconobacter oxydans 621H]